MDGNVAVGQSPALLVRQRAARVCAANGGGYFVQVCSSAEILTTLFGRVMDLGPSSGPLLPDDFVAVPRPGSPQIEGARYNGDRDRFFLSPAHYALGLYATLAEFGRLSEDAFENVNADGSTLEMIGAEHSPGFEATTGSLAQALSVAVGRALARHRFGRPGRVWALISDGELQEGQTWEALQAASNFRLDNLTILLDANGLQVDGPMANVMNVEPIADKVRAFGMTTIEVDGHVPDAIVAAAAQRQPGRPTFIVCRTSPTRGVPSLANRHQLHYIRFRDGEVASLYADLGITEEVTA
jgi:transketolase